MKQQQRKKSFFSAALESQSHFFFCILNLIPSDCHDICTRVTYMLTHFTLIVTEPAVDMGLHQIAVVTMFRGLNNPGQTNLSRI